ncbi:MAG TPA: hypothetical protein VHZ49_12720 [Methylomirabilota bacterium]|nr:hypothetical protein [Methylomirabilota bacterium]
MDPNRDRLRDLSARLLRLHKVLLDRERGAYEDRFGAVPPGELFRLLLHDAGFAWLRALSAMIADIDEAADADEPIATETVERAVAAAFALLKAGGEGEFQLRYQDALQSSPEVVMAHAEISKLIRRAS